MLSRQCEPVQDAIRGVVRETCRRPQAVALDQQGQGFEYRRARAAQGLEERMLIRTEGVSARRAVIAPLHVAECPDGAGSDFPVVGARRGVAPLLSQFHDASPPERDDTSGGRSRLTDTLGIFHGGLSHCGRSGWWTARTVRASKSARCSAATSKDIVSCGPHTVLLTTRKTVRACPLPSRKSRRIYAFNKKPGAIGRAGLDVEPERRRE